MLTLNATIATKVVCLSRLLKCLSSLYDSVGPDQTAPIGAVCSGSTLFASMLNSLGKLGNYLQQTTSADDIFRCVFSWRFNHVNRGICAYAMRTKTSCACTYNVFVYTLENHRTRKVQSSRFSCSQRGHSMKSNIFKMNILALQRDFQQCGILTSVDSDKPVQPPFELRNSK